MQMMQPFKLSKLRSLSTHRKYTRSDNPRSFDNCLSFLYVHESQNDMFNSCEI